MKKVGWDARGKGGQEPQAAAPVVVRVKSGYLVQEPRTKNQEPRSKKKEPRTQNPEPQRQELRTEPEDLSAQNG